MLQRQKKISLTVPKSKKARRSDGSTAGSSNGFESSLDFPADNWSRRLKIEERCLSFQKVLFFFTKIHLHKKYCSFNELPRDGIARIPENFTFTTIWASTSPGTMTPVTGAKPLCCSPSSRPHCTRLWIWKLESRRRFFYFLFATLRADKNLKIKWMVILTCQFISQRICLVCGQHTMEMHIWLSC